MAEDPVVDRRRGSKVRLVLAQDTIETIAFLASILGVTPNHYETDAGYFAFVNRGPPEKLPRGSATAIGFMGKEPTGILIRLILNDIGDILQADIKYFAGSPGGPLTAIVDHFKWYKVKVIKHAG